MGSEVADPAAIRKIGYYLGIWRRGDSGGWKVRQVEQRWPWIVGARVGIGLGLGIFLVVFEGEITSLTSVAFLGLFVAGMIATGRGHQTTTSGRGRGSWRRLRAAIVSGPLVGYSRQRRCSV